MIRRRRLNRIPGEKVKAVKKQGRGIVLAWAIKKVLLVVSSGAWYGNHQISAGERGKGQTIWVNWEKDKDVERKPTECLEEKNRVYKAWSTPKYVR